MSSIDAIPEEIIIGFLVLATSLIKLTSSISGDAIYMLDSLKILKVL